MDYCALDMCDWLWVWSLNGEQPSFNCTLYRLLSPVTLRQVPLIGTHMLAFGLIPTSMWTMYKRLPQLKKWGAADPFLAMTGVAFLMVRSLPS